MARVIGIDFGTTNSLISVILDEQARNFLNDKGMPHPSSVCYDGGNVIAGTKAKERIDDTDSSMSDSLVRSPKVQLARDNIYINGREMDPVTVVADLMIYLKDSALADHGSVDVDLTRAVVSIPVAMEGRTRKRLRDALMQAGIHVVQFVHEPLAALYAYFKDQDNFSHTLSKYQGRLALVFDWGGGTLDLTLCRVVDGAVTQIMNLGDNGVGGDYVDEAILSHVLECHAKKEGVPSGTPVEPGARAKLLNACEKAKIDLSTKEKALIYVPDYYIASEFDVDIEYAISRSELVEISAHYVNRGLGCIDQLLKKLNIDQRQVSLCLATGGMVNMPIIRSRLEQIFSIDRLEISSKGDRIISEGCAWIAHDGLQMCLAKPIEIAEARGAFLPVFKSGTRLPVEGDAIRNQVGMYCVDPRDEKAKIKIVRPKDVGKTAIADERLAYDLLVVNVDSKAKPFLERLVLDFIIDDNFIVNVTATSSLLGDSCSCEIFDLEFSLTLPNGGGRGTNFLGEGFEYAGSNPETGIVISRENVVHESIDPSGRPNIIDIPQEAVPGEYLYTYSPRSFDRESSSHATELQILEYLYYQPCSICNRSFNDENCRCASDPEL